jgi:RHS repeat-associated protein
VLKLKLSGLDRPVEMRKYKEQGERSYFFHQNSIGSVYFITDEEGKIVEKVEYDPYGEPRFLIPTGDQGNPYNLSETSTIGNAYLFQGREYDYETSLYNFRMRYYDPELCRFISPDPEGYKDSVNLYQSFNQNPVNFTDPYGLQFRAGDTPYLTKKEEEEALKKIALSKEERERIKEAFSESEVGAFLESFFRGEGFKIGWESGYYECYLKCLTGPFGVFAGAHIGLELGSEKIGEMSAKTYYHLTDKRFQAWGKFSKKLVPQLTGKIAKFIKGGAATWLAVDAWLCLFECLHYLE